MGTFAFGFALLLFVCGYAHGQRNTDVPRPPPNFVPGEVKPPATSRPDTNSRRQAPKEAPAEKNDQTGGVKPKENAKQPER